MDKNIFKDFWKNKLKENKYVLNSNINSKIKFCFDYKNASLKNIDKIYFDSDNWNDYALMDFRNFLDNVKFQPFENEYFTVIHNFNNDQNNFYFLSKYDQPDFVFSIYKNRGRIEQAFNVNTGKPISLVEMTFLLIDLGLDDMSDEEINSALHYY